MYRLSHKVSNASNIIDPVINGFSTNDVSSHFHICDHSIVTFGIREKCIWFSETSRVDILYRFRRSVVDKFKIDICILKKVYHSKENNMEVQYAIFLLRILGWVIPQHKFISSFKIKRIIMTHR